MESLESERIFLQKRLGILKFLSVLEAFLVGFLLFVFVKDAVMALAGAVLVGVLFYRLTNRKLVLAKSNLEKNFFQFFLKRNGGKLDKKLLQKDFEKLALSEKLKEFRSGFGVKFEKFSLYDLHFKDDKGRFFCGVLICFREKISLSGDENLIYHKLNRKNFSLENIFARESSVLVASLISPFFVDLKKDLEQNYKRMQGNFTLIASLAK